MRNIIIENKVTRTARAVLSLPTVSEGAEALRLFYARLEWCILEFIKDEHERVRSYKSHFRTCRTEDTLTVDIFLTARTAEHGEYRTHRRQLHDVWRDGALILHEVVRRED